MGVDFIDTSSIGDCLDSNNLSAVLLCTANSFLFFFFFGLATCSFMPSDCLCVLHRIQMLDL